MVGWGNVIVSTRLLSHGDMLAVKDRGAVAPVSIGLDVRVADRAAWIGGVGIGECRETLFELVLSESSQLSFFSRGPKHAQVEDDDEHQTSHQRKNPPFAAHRRAVVVYHGGGGV